MNNLECASDVLLDSLNSLIDRYPPQSAAVNSAEFLLASINKTSPDNSEHAELTATKEVPELAATIEMQVILDRFREQIIAATSFEVFEKASELSICWLREFFNNHPDDRREVTDTIQSSGIKDFPWQSVQPDPEGIAFLYNFSPFQDTGATVASKRIRNFSATIDVISCSFLHRKKMDQTVESIAEPYVRRRIFLPTVPSWDDWEKYKAYSRDANKEAEQLIRRGANYSFCYSRAMWAPSMFAGADFKFKNPIIKWIAEFSDPLSLDVEGKRRGKPVPNDSVFSSYKARLKSDYSIDLTEDTGIFELAELLVYAYADEIIFTNDHQKTVMLEKIESSGLKKRVEEKSKVSNHPTLPRSYYSQVKSAYKTSDQVLNLGYFGEFYSSRSITEVTSAMRTLPKHLAERVHLHVFTNYIPAGEGNRRPRQFSQKQYDDLVKRAHTGVGSDGIEHLVTFNPSLPYLQFLSTADKLDYLIVNDAESGPHHQVNPYLPSKWSDYAGSVASTWAFVEEGSILSQKPATIKTPVGDAYEARIALWNMILTKFPELEEKS